VACIIKINTSEVFHLAATLVVLGGDVAKAFRCEDFDKDDAVADDHHRCWNYISQDEIGPVPHVEKERHKLTALGYND